MVAEFWVAVRDRVAPFQPISNLGRHGGILRISRVGPMASDRPPPCTSCRSRPTHMTMSRLAGYSVSCPGGGSSYVTTHPLLCQGEFRRKPLPGAVLLAFREIECMPGAWWASGTRKP